MKGNIYALKTHNDKTLTYIGSTILTLHERHTIHKYKHKLYIEDRHHYITAFKVIEKGSTYMELLESIDCNTKEELLKKEGDYMKTIKCVNKNIAGRSSKQYYIDNREAIIKKQTRWNNNNREHRSRQCLCVCGASVSYRNMKSHRKTKKHNKLFIQVLDKRIQEMEIIINQL
jgi:hypothetical protein